MARIHFVVNTTGLTGGIRVVFEYANRLQARGHTVTIYYPYNLSEKNWPQKEGWISLAKRVKYTLKPSVEWFDLKVPVVRVPRLIGRHMPDADIVIATANETADWVAQLPARCGSKFYFIQGLEVWSRDPEKVLATWKLPLRKIVIASWLKEYAHGIGEEVIACITNGVNLEEFHCKDRVKNKVPKVLMMTHVLATKGTDDGLAALEKVRKTGRNFEITLFGAYPLKKPKEGMVFVGNPGKKIRELYCAHDIFVSPSWSEGCQLPPMEAMACGCAVVATNVGGIPDYAIADKTAIVVEPKHPDEIAKGLVRLLDDETLLSDIAQSGHEHIQAFSWDFATDQFERALTTYA
jgi:glycosyltransferase involved in cell wall biosynthesis